ncbi:uncharacterized protein C16orf90 homolog isoform X1 [Felis catus]|uniref:Uncharacterized protein n=2 Tax=Felis catus TaxID=9685 RepID=A0ABI7WUW5_FELCA|nr:uncharacterized protein C16orf90 homolog isoform X1 [Felis catus]
MSKLTPQEVTEGVTLRPSRPESVLCGLSQTRRSGTSSRIPLPSLALHPPFPYPGASYSPKLGGPGRLGVFRLTSQSRLPRETCRPRQGRAEPCCTGGPAAPPPPRWPSMEALVCAFSELRIREDAVSWARGHPSHPDTPPNIYEGGLGAQQQCPGAQGSKPKNFRLRHLRGLGLYLPSHMQPAGQGESHWLGQLMARGCLPPPEGMAWPLDLPHGTLGPGDSHRSVLLETQVPGDSLENPASSSSVDPAKGAPSQPAPPEGLGLRPKRSWGASEESTCPLCKRTRSGALERP